MRRGVARERHQTDDATALLSGMILDHTVTHFLTNFETVRRRGVLPEITAWIRDKDDIACARAAKRIRDELQPLLGIVKVTVEPDPWIPDYRGKSGE